jgi:phage N-6-adenine-methyltransferase
MFTSATCDWATPLDVFADLNREFGFTLDVCASPHNAKVDRYISSEDLWGGLNQPWSGVCWMNPPYGKTIGAWVKKAWESSQQGATVVCLLPSRTDTRWWHDYCMKADEIRFLKGRLKFMNPDYKDSKHVAPFPSAVVVFRPPA